MPKAQYFWLTFICPKGTPAFSTESSFLPSDTEQKSCKWGSSASTYWSAMLLASFVLHRHQKQWAALHSTTNRKVHPPCFGLQATGIMLTLTLAKPSYQHCLGAVNSTWKSSVSHLVFVPSVSLHLLALVHHFLYQHLFPFLPSPLLQPNYKH